MLLPGAPSRLNLSIKAENECNQQAAAEHQWKPLAQFWVHVGRPDAIVASGLLTVLLLSPRILRHLPLNAITTGDSAAYLAGASFRPPLYGWFLNSWLWLHGDLTNLSIVQAVMLLAAVALFAVEFGLMMRNAVVAAATGPLLFVHPEIERAPALGDDRVPLYRHCPSSGWR